jgi:hypothetical protein
MSSPSKLPRLGQFSMPIHMRECSSHPVARFLEKIDVEAIILAEQIDGGRTIIEKFEDHAGEAAYSARRQLGAELGLISYNRYSKCFGAVSASRATLTPVAG